MPYWVYILECGDRSWYTGITNDIEKRLVKHNSGKGSKYTRGRLPVKLIYTLEVKDKGEALREEYRIKRLSKADKGKLFH